jgi:hypothetical protein
MRELRTLETNNPALQRENERPFMAMRRTQSNIINLAFAISTEDGKSGVHVTQTVINGQSHAVGMRTVNGARKSAEVKLDVQAMTDLRDAITEILAGDEG